MGIVIKQSIAPALPPATSVRQPPFCFGADDSGAALRCVLSPASSGVWLLASSARGGGCLLAILDRNAARQRGSEASARRTVSSKGRTLPADAASTAHALGAWGTSSGHPPTSAADSASLRRLRQPPPPSRSGGRTRSTGDISTDNPPRTTLIATMYRQAILHMPQGDPHTHPGGKLTWRSHSWPHSRLSMMELNLNFWKYRLRQQAGSLFFLTLTLSTSCRTYS